MEIAIVGKIKKFGNNVEISNYSIPVWTGIKKYDVKIEDKYYKKVQKFGRPEQLVEVKVGSQGRKDLLAMKNGEVINYMNNKVINIKRKKREFKELYHCNILQHTDLEGKVCLPKMLTFTFKQNILNYDIAISKFRKAVERFERFISNVQGEKFKLVACGVKEVHAEKRDGYHFHLICFNVPYVPTDLFKEYSSKEHDKFGRINLQVLKGFNNKIVNLSYDSDKDSYSMSSESVNYLSKSLEYLSKDLEDMYKIDYSVDLTENKELLQKLQKEAGKTVLYKTGKLIKPETISLESEKEFEDNLIDLYNNYHVQSEISFFTDFLGWVDLYSFVVNNNYYVDGVLQALNLKREDILSNKNEYLNYRVTSFFIDYKDDCLMYVGNNSFDVIKKDMYKDILKLDISGDIREFINKKLK